jgi:hypothetical protein
MPSLTSHLGRRSATRQEFDDSGLDSLPASTSWEDWKEDASSAWDGASTAWDEWWKEEEAEEPTFTPPPMSLKAAAKKMDKADMLIAVGMKEDLCVRRLAAGDRVRRQRS